MPGTDLRYEDFEGFLASFALTLGCLEFSGRTGDVEDHRMILEILGGFAERYNVRPPLVALRSPRSKRWSAKPQEFTNEELVYMINSFGRDFNVGHVDRGGNYDLDAAERRRLGRIILELLDRYALADIVYRDDGEERVPVRVKKWVLAESRYKRLSETVREWRSWQA
jgi:hypothetical protein